MRILKTIDEIYLLPLYFLCFRKLGLGPLVHVIVSNMTGAMGLGVPRRGLGTLALLN